MSNLAVDYIQDGTSGIIVPQRSLGDAIWHVHHFSDATRNIAGSNTSSTTILTFSFTKQNSTAAIVIEGFMPSSGSNSNRCGERIGLQNGTGTIYYKYHPIFYIMGGGGDDGRRSNMDFQAHWSSAQVPGTGTKTIHIGYSSRDGSAQKAGQFTNPENRSARSRVHTTSVVIWEVDPLKFNGGSGGWESPGGDEFGNAYNLNQEENPNFVDS